MTLLMRSHMESIPFENLDVVLRATPEVIPMKTEWIVDKLVLSQRGGYCFEQATVLLEALVALGFSSVRPVLSRVRWGKAPEQQTGTTHMFVTCVIDSVTYLADVGFAGTNSVAPINLSIGDEPQQKPEGVFRVVKKDDDYSYLEVQDRNVETDWRALYCWNDVPALTPDLECWNYFSCQFPTARFTNQCFISKLVKNERCFILNDKFIRRDMNGEKLEEETITTKHRLEELVTTFFGIALPEKRDGIDKFL
ncbi:hypothetical protein TL16_g04579 [Triparma laevis f. inornata]|uniref:Arylamine N-acetyltransferase n=1 Tax=Triparma laevis f. inornata TaxID=1714386 RepID=A0A9W7E658_9STRA|nr:hypothetical protein TL16_g04579 [Triparma laevis f. inornata]